MANPQKENGHVDIANEIMEALAKINTSAYQSRILRAIWRKTYGWHKKEDWISHSQLIELTGLAKGHISRTLAELETRCLVTRSGNKIAFQKDYDKWRELPNGVTPYRKLPNGVTHKVKGEKSLKKKKKLPNGVTVTHPGFLLPNGVDTKETIQKKNHKHKRKVRLFQSDHIAFRLATYFLERIRLNKPDFKEPNLQFWSRTFDLMLRRDKREARQIALVIKWAQADNVPRGKGRFCWAINVLSPTSLRGSFDRLELEMKDSHEKADAPPSQDLEKTEKILEQYRTMEAESAGDPEGVKKHIAEIIKQLGDGSPELKGEAAHEFEEKRRLLQEKLKQLTGEEKTNAKEERAPEAPDNP